MDYQGTFGRGAARPSYSALATDPAPSNDRPGAPGAGLTGWDKAIAEVNAGGNMAPPAMAARTHVFNVDPVDPVDRLPPAAKEKLLAFREARSAAHAGYRPMADQELELTLDLQRAQASLRHTIENAPHTNFDTNPLKDGDGNPLPGVHPAKRERLAQIERIQTQRDRARAAKEARAAASQYAARLATRVEEFIASLPSHATISDAPVVLKKSDTLDSLRGRIVQLQADRDAALAAPRPSAVTKAAARAEIERLAERGRPHVLSAIEHGEAIRWPVRQTAVDIRGVLAFAEADGAVSRLAGTPNAETIDTLAMFAWLNRNALVAAINAEIDALSDDGRAMTDAQRTAKVRELDDEILAAERIEAALVDATGAKHRDDVDERALLAIAIQ